MFYSTILLPVFFSCLTQTIAAPASTASTTPGFEVSPFTITGPTGEGKNKAYKVTFGVHDPNTHTNASAICKATITPSSAVVSDPTWLTCTDAPSSKGHGAEFGFYFEQFKSLSNFRLHIQHGYLDKSVGPCSTQPDGTKIYCDVVYFADRVVSAKKGDLKCEGKTCTNTFSKKAKTINIAINAAIA